MNILLGITGSIACNQTPKLFNELRQIGDVQGVITNSAKNLIDKVYDKHHELFEEIYNNHILTDDDEWEWTQLGDPIQHIELKKWADIFVIAPLSANTLAKMAAGMCDNLLTSVYRAWPRHKPIVVVPAMNTDMWSNPITHEHIDKLRIRHNSRSYHSVGFYSDKDATFSIVTPVEKTLACGDTGIGALASIEDIVKHVEKTIKVFY